MGYFFADETPRYNSKSSCLVLEKIYRRLVGKAKCSHGLFSWRRCICRSDNVTKEVIQISKIGDSGWIPDATIVKAVQIKGYY